MLFCWSLNRSSRVISVSKRWMSTCHFQSQIYYSTNSQADKLTKENWPKRVISGVQPTGILHLGNYFGAVRRWVELQDSGEDVAYFLADLHSMTLPYEADVLRENIFQMVATLLACGITPTNLFLQSSVPQHTELCWIFSCMTTMIRLSNLPQFKEKSATVRDVPAGLFFYPVLQAADVLVHKGTHVPCGDDQAQQLQLAQHLAKIFNTKFGRTFPMIEPMIADDPSSRIKSLRDPSKKQSKSDPNTKSRITLRDTPDEVLLKIKKAVTDFTSEVTFDPDKRPGVSNLITMHSLVANKTPEEICEQVKGLDTGKYKLVVAEALIEHLEPIRLKIEDYLKNRDYLSDVLKSSQDKATERAEQTIKEVKSKIGVGVLR